MITHKHLDIASLTNSPSLYFDMFRSFTRYGVEILRNEFDIKDGITIVGHKELVEEVISGITEVIKKIESKASKPPKTFHKVTLHFSRVKSLYKSDLINRVAIISEHDKNKPPISRDKEKAEKALRLAYIKSCSLRNLKRFYGK